MIKNLLFFCTQILNSQKTYIYLQCVKQKTIDKMNNQIFYVKGKRVSSKEYSNFMRENALKFKSMIFETWRIAGRIIYVNKIS